MGTGEGTVTTCGDGSVLTDGGAAFGGWDSLITGGVSRRAVTQYAPVAITNTLAAAPQGNNLLLCNTGLEYGEASVIDADAGLS